GRPGTPPWRAGTTRASGGSGPWTWSGDSLRLAPRAGSRQRPERRARGADATRSPRRSPRLERQRPVLAVVADSHRLAVADLALEQEPGQRRLQLALDGALQRAGAVGRLVPHAHQVLAGGVVQLQGDVPLRQALAEVAELDIDDLLQVLHA